VNLPQFKKLLYCDPSFIQDMARSSRADLLVIRHHYATVRIGAPEDYVASLLSIHDEPNALEHTHQLLPGNVRGQLH
jgi:hypothetical protein